ncbi:MAG: O-antigen ligase family protein [Verrucomicrobia bacterium]|nr:O-antigen ligase family protein [Verrucomicrobiota bacterium]
MAQFKYLIFFAVLIVGVPLGIILSNKHPLVEKLVVIFLVFSTVVPDDTGINFCSREFYFALTKGFEISLGDLTALVLLGSIYLKRDEYNAPGLPPLSILFVLILVTYLLSWVTAPMSVPVPLAAQEHPFAIPYDNFETKLYPLFETSKWLRGFLLFLAIYYYLRKPENLDIVLFAICFATIYLGLVVMSDRYIHHINRVKATLPHPNALATYMAMSATLIFSALLAEKRLARILMQIFALALAGLSVVMTISRGGLGALVIGLTFSFLLLGWRNICAKNIIIVILGALAAVVVLIAAADTLLARFVGQQDAAGDLEYRMYYNNQAKIMARERPFGVGGGNFSALSWDRYAAMVDPDNPPGTPAHNIWFLTLGETGYPGLIVFMCLWLRFFSMAAPFILWRLKGMELAALTGATLLCLVCHVQAMVQLSFRQTPIFFLIMISLAIVSALARNWQAQHQAMEQSAEPVPA